jgi:hypothetical protein
MKKIFLKTIVHTLSMARKYKAFRNINSDALSLKGPARHTASRMPWKCYCGVFIGI